MDLFSNGPFLTDLASSSTPIQTVSVSIEFDFVWFFEDRLLTRQQAETVTAITKKTCLVLDHFLGQSQDPRYKFRLALLTSRSQNRTLYVGRIHVTDDIEEVVSRHFAEWGQIDVRLLV